MAKKTPEQIAAEKLAAAENGSGLTVAEQPEEGTVVNLKETMWIEGTGESRHLPKGTKHEVNVIAGAKLISKKAAVETKAPVKPKAPVKKQKDEEED